MKRKVQTLQTKLWRKGQIKKLSKKAELNNSTSQLATHLPMHTVNFIKRQILLHQSEKTHQHYAVSDKMMALSIFYQSRKAYGILSKLFALPSKRTLQRSMHNTNVMPGFVDTIFDALKIKTSTLEEKDKYVALVFDEMTLKTDLKNVKVVPPIRQK